MGIKEALAEVAEHRGRTPYSRQKKDEVAGAGSRAYLLFRVNKGSSDDESHLCLVSDLLFRLQGRF